MTEMRLWQRGIGMREFPESQHPHLPFPTICFVAKLAMLSASHHQGGVCEQHLSTLTGTGWAEGQILACPAPRSWSLCSSRSPGLLVYGGIPHLTQPH